MAKRQSPSARLKAKYRAEAKKEKEKEKKARGTVPRFEDEKETPSAGGTKGSTSKPPAKQGGGSK